MIEIKKTGRCKDCNYADLYLDCIGSYDSLYLIHCRHENACRENENALHDLLQDAIDANEITEAQAVRIMERVKG